MGFFSKLAEKAEADELARSVDFDIEHYASPTININGDDVELEKSMKPGIWNVIHDDHVVGWIHGPTEYLVDHADEIKIVIGEDIPKVRIVKPEDFDEAEEEEFTGKDTSVFCEQVICAELSVVKPGTVAVYRLESASVSVGRIEALGIVFLSIPEVRVPVRAAHRHLLFLCSFRCFDDVHVCVSFLSL